MRIENSLSPPCSGVHTFQLSSRLFKQSVGGEWTGSVSGVAANPLTVNQIKQQPSAKSDTRLLFYSADLQHVVRHGSHGIHSPIPIPISPQSLYLMPPSATQSHQSCHGAATERPQSHHIAATERPQSHHIAATNPTASSHLIPISPHSLYLMPPSATQSHQSCHGSHGIIPSHPHLPTVALPNATFGYSKSSELPRSCHGSHGIPHPHSHLPTVALPNATFGYSKSSELSRSGHGATTVLSRSRHGVAMEPPQSCHGSHGIISSTSPHSRST